MRQTGHLNHLVVQAAIFVKAFWVIGGNLKRKIFGISRAVNLRLAVRWLARAAEGESARAAATLAGLFLTGNVFELNRLHAWILLQRAKALGDPTADATALGLKDLLDPRERSEGRKLLKRCPDTKSLLEALLPKNWKR